MVIRTWPEVIARSVLLSLLSTAACAADPSTPETVRDPDPSNADGDDDGDDAEDDDLDGGATARVDSGKKPGIADSGSSDTSDRPTTATRGDAAVAAQDGRVPADPAAADGAAPKPDGGSQAVEDPAGLWIAPSGSDQNPGTKEQPLKSLSAAHERAMAGTTIWVSPGTYALSETVKLTRSGQEDKPIAVYAAPGARPVFDFATQPRGDSAARGVQISANYWHIRGIDFVNAGDNCIHISGSHNTIEHVVTHGCSDTGIQITANSSEAADPTRAAHNTILNCDSYENYDGQNQGENADGFAAKLYIGPGNVFRGCRAWNNSDDGWDLFASDDVVVIENSWAMSNGKIGPSQSNTNGDGNGFKLGGAPRAGDANQGGAVHLVRNCVSISNRACGFVRNNNTKVPELTSCGGQGDGKGTYCSLTASGAAAAVTMTAAQAIAAPRDADGNLPKMKLSEPDMTNSKMAALLFVCALGVSTPARAADFYVAVDGADTNPGTLDSPFQTLKRAELAASAGDTVYLRGGVYRFSGTQTAIGVSFTKSGATDRPIRYFAYQDETPILDLFELKPQERITGVDVRCNWIHLRGLEVRGVRQLIVGDSWGVRIRGDHNVIERLTVHDNQAPGIFITSGKSNLVLNCDSHHNYDPLEQGGNADGFGCHASGGDNVLRGCRAWENSDDGYDFINAAGTCIAEGSWAFRNGWIPDTNMGVGNGAGFKSGGYGVPPNTPATGVPRHVVRKSVSFGNRAIGFYANYHPGGLDFLNNTAFDNPANYDMRIPPQGSPSTHKLRNNIAAGTGRTIVSFNGGTDTFNSWTLPVQVTAADFVSLDKAIGLMPRQADGSLPDMSLARLTPDSDLIDRGEDVGLPFAGKSPDLGAHEWGESAPIATSDAGTTDAAPSTDAGRRPTDAGGSSSGPPQTDASTRAPGKVGPDAGVVARPDGSTMVPAQDEDNDDDPSLDEAEAAPASAEGCGCQVHATRSRVGAWGVLLAGLCLALRARTRRARRA